MLSPFCTISLEHAGCTTQRGWKWEEHCYRRKTYLERIPQNEVPRDAPLLKKQARARFSHTVGHYSSDPWNRWNISIVRASIHLASTFRHWKNVYAASPLEEKESGSYCCTASRSCRRARWKETTHVRISPCPWYWYSYCWLQYTGFLGWCLIDCPSNAICFCFGFVSWSCHELNDHALMYLHYFAWLEEFSIANAHVN